MQDMLRKLAKRIVRRSEAHFPGATGWLLQKLRTHALKPQPYCHETDLSEDLPLTYVARMKGDDGMADYPTTRPSLAFDYLSGLVRWLASSDYRLISYADLGAIQHGEEGPEFQNWIAKAKKGGEKAVLLHYDVDARPDVTHALLKTHIECRVPANVMIFRRKIFDWKLKRDGVIEFDESYKIDMELLDRFQKIGGVVGYHCNAFDLSGGDTERAIEIFHEDIAELRKNLDIRFFSMHGGLVTPDGMSNSRLNVEPHLEALGLQWVHNGHSVYFHSNWADGSASNPRYRNECSSPLDFLLSTKAGERCRLLFHPQYYNDFSNSRFDFPILQDQKWVAETVSEVSGKKSFNGKKYWAGRMAEAKASTERFEKLYKPEGREEPVFINGMSRSGTTLLVSMFDAHPEGAMAYESYPRYLHAPSDNGVLTAEEYMYAYQTLMNYPDNVAFQLLDRPPLRNLMRFAAVNSWTGMSTAETGELLRTYLIEHYRVADAQEALKIVAASARYKLRKQGASFWGSKCQGNFDDYIALWPKARLIYILRNGLDILASQKTTGAFNPIAETLGRNWRQNYERFSAFAAQNPNVSTCLVQYEKLVSSPEEAARDMCEAIGLPFHSQMIRQHEIKTTLAENPRGQLSAERVQQPIDTSSINRWKTILTSQEVEEFLKGCGGTELFERFGLDWEF